MKDKFDLAIYNRLRNGGEIAAELPASTQERRKWIAIGKPNHKPFGTEHLDYVYIVVHFEMEKSDLDNNSNNNYNEELHDKKHYFPNSDEELLQLLETLKADPKSFTYPWKCDYP